MALIRINKYLAKNGLCSRRSADKLIVSGKVFVNGKKTTELGLKIDDAKDKVSLAGEELKLVEQTVYYALNKPTGYITTAKDPKGRKKVIDLVPKYPKVYPVGRLDNDSEGLIILTNDGDFTYKMIHPKFEKEKEYEVVAKLSSDKAIKLDAGLEKLFLSGIKLKEGVAKADKFGIVEQKGDKIIFKIVIHQGWNRQIRRMCATAGLDVLKLKRIRIGRLKLGNIKIGEYKVLTKKEIEGI